MQPYESVCNFYNTYDEDARLGSRAGSVEFLTTVAYIERYLRPGMRILEIGAGTGRYSHHFARAGYDVTAVELMPCFVDHLRTTTESGEPLTVYEGDARALTMLEDEQFDIILLFGPLYHLFTDVDRTAALTEALRVLKSDGLLFTAFCMNEATVIRYCFVRGAIHETMRKGNLDDSFKCLSDPHEIFDLHRRETIDALMAPLPVTRLHFVATDLFTHYIRDTVNAMDDATFDLYLRYHMSICERPDVVGISNHTLDISRKKENPEPHDSQPRNKI